MGQALETDTKVANMPQIRIHAHHHKPPRLFS